MTAADDARDPGYCPYPCGMTYGRDGTCPRGDRCPHRKRKGHDDGSAAG